MPWFLQVSQLQLEFVGERKQSQCTDYGSFNQQRVIGQSRASNTCSGLRLA